MALQWGAGVAGAEEEGEVVVEAGAEEGEEGEAEEGEVVGGHHQICRTMIWDHFHRGTGIPRLHG